MAYLATYKQQPAERLDYDIWFANDPDGSEDWLVNGDIITGLNTEIPEGLNVVSTFFSDRVKLWVSGGTSGVAYKVTLTVTTLAERTKQVELRFRIKDE